MKNCASFPFSHRFLAVQAVVVAFYLPFDCVSADVIKADNANALNLQTSYVGSNTVPTSNDVLFVTNVLTANRGPLMGANLSLKGIEVTNAGFDLTIGNTGTASTLTLGSAGITVGNAGAGNLVLNAPRLDINVAQSWTVASGKQLSIGANTASGGGFLTGTATITKNGAGTLLVNVANSSSGGFVLNEGIVLIRDSGATTPFGTGALTINGGELASANSGNRTITNAIINIGGNFIVSNFSNTGAITLAGAINLGGAVRQVTMAAGGATAKFGLTGTTSVSNGTLSVQTNQASSIFSVGTIVNFVGNSGLIIGNNVSTTFGAANALGGGVGIDSASVTVEAGGTLDLSNKAANSRNIIVHSLSGSGTVTNNTTGSGTAGFTIDGASGTSTFAGIIRDGATGHVSLTKSRGSTLVLSGSNTYTGGTILNTNAGTLMLGDGTASGSIVGNVSVGSGAILAFNPGASGVTYSGTISGQGAVNKTGSSTAVLNGLSSYTGTTTVSGGKLVVGSAGNPSASIASSTLVVSGVGSTVGGIGTLGATNIGAGAILAPGNSTGTINTGNLSIDGTYAFELDSINLLADQINVTGSVTLGAGSLFSGLDLGSDPIALNTIFVIINNDGVDLINGTFSNLANGAQIAIGSTLFEANYTGGTGNDLTLTAVVPEPGTTGLTAVGLLGCLMLARRRRDLR